MTKKALGLVLSVALLMVVLSGCFLLPQPDTTPPTVSITSPTNGQVITIGDTGSVTVSASVTAKSPIQTVDFTLTSGGVSQTVSAQGPIGQTSGTFSYTFTSLTKGDYGISVAAYSSAKYPGRASSKFSLSAQAVNPVVSALSLTPNYQGHFVTSNPVTFGATVTDPNNTGTLKVTATVNGNPANLVSGTNGFYSFNYTPTTAGTYTFAVNASITAGASTLTASNSMAENVYDMPTATINTKPVDYSVATAPASFTFTTVSAEAYLSVNGSTYAPYTSGTAISNLVPNQWNTLMISFKDAWGNVFGPTETVHVLGVQSSNNADTPYVFLIDKDGHVVNTNDWIHVPAGQRVDLYGYILQGKDAINNYNIQESYYTNENLTTMLYTGSVASQTSLSVSKLPIRLVAYMLNPQATDTFVKFDINVNHSAAAFIRYDVAKVATGSIDLSVNPSDTYEGAQSTVNVTFNSVQPITSLVLGQPSKLNTPFLGYATTTAYSNSQNNTTTMNFGVKYIVPVSQVTDINSYGTAYGTIPYQVAFYGPSGEYGIGATVTSIAAQSLYATGTYKVQADTDAPTIKITPAGSYVTINNTYVYYGPMTVTATITDDHAIYWAGLSFASTPFIVYKNDSNISNYGVTATSLKATVPFSGIGTYTVYAKASDKHFDPTHYWTGNTAQSTPVVSAFYDNGSNLVVNSVGGQYNADVNSETYAFAVSASDGSGIGLSNEAFVKLVPVSGQGTTTFNMTANLSASGSTPTYYNAQIDTYNLTNKTQYKVQLGIKDKIYDLLSPSLPATSPVLAAHIRWVNWGYITVDHVYPNVALSAGSSYSPIATSTTSVSTNLFRVDINNDPYFPWALFAENNYNQLLNYVNVQIGPENGPVSPTLIVPVNVSQTSTQSGYFVFAIPGLYQNASATSSAMATRTIQVSVYNSIQPDKALFGQTVATVVPSVPFNVVFSASNGMQTGTTPTSTPLVTNKTTYPINVTISGLSGNQSNMQLIFMANATQIAVVNPAANGTYPLSIPVQAGTSVVSVRVLYAPTYYNVPGSAKIASYTPPTSYDYYRYYSTLYVLGDTIAPTSAISVNGMDVTGQSTVVTSGFLSSYAVNGVLYYLHNLPIEEGFATTTNTSINGQIQIATYATQTYTTLATPTLRATDSLGAIGGFTQGSPWTVSRLLGTSNEAGVYRISFTGHDPFYADTTANATVVVDLVPPALSTVTLNEAPISDATSGIVPTVASGDPLTIAATDDAGVASATVTVTNLLYSTSTTLTTVLSANGIGAFNSTLSANAVLPNVFAPQFQNLPYVVTANAKDVAGRSANTITRLLVTNVDHSPYVSKIIAVAANKALVRLTEPMWVNGFKLFTASSNNYGGVVTSSSITPANVLATYEGAQIANEFYITFPYDVWNTTQVGNDVQSDLTSVQMSSNTNSYVAIVDLAGNKFAMPINTTVPPVFNVTPMATTIGKDATVTFTVDATSVAGIQKIVGDFYGQTKVLYAANGTMTFVGPTISGTYTASFTAYDNSVSHNSTVKSPAVYVNATNPTLKFVTLPATFGSGAGQNVTVVATVGSAYGAGNSIVSVKINGVAATYNSGTNLWTANVVLNSAVSGTMSVVATATDSYGNLNTTSNSVYVDNQNPTVYVQLVGGTGQTTSPLALGNGASMTVYTKTQVTVGASVTDDSNMPVTASGNVGGTAFTFTNMTTAVGSETSNVIKNSNGQYTVSLVATDAFGHTTTYTATFTLVVDNTNPTVSVDGTPTSGSIDVNSVSAIATYTATDTGALLYGQPKLTVTFGSSSVSKWVNAGIGATTDIIDLLTDSSLGLVGNSGNVEITVAATDNAGNSAYDTSVIKNIDFTFKTTNVVRQTTSGSPITVTFNTIAKANGSFVPSDVYFYNSTNGFTYEASDITVPTGTTNVATITGFAAQGSGAFVSSKNLPAGSYDVYVSNIVGATPTTEGAQVSNNPYTSFTIGN